MLPELSLRFWSDKTWSISFSLYSPVFSTHKTNLANINEILLKGAGGFHHAMTDMFLNERASDCCLTQVSNYSVIW